MDGVEERVVLHPITSLLLGWLVGVFISSLFPALFFFVVPATVAFLLLLFSLRLPLTTKSPRVIAILFCIALSLGMARFSFSYDALEQKINRLQIGKDKLFSGVVVQNPEQRKFGIQFVAEGIVASEKIKLLVRVPDGTVSFGDSISLQGEIKKPEPFVTSSGSLFDYPDYLKKDGIVGIVDAKDIHIEKQHHYSVLGMLYKFNNMLTRTVSSLVPGARGDLTNGVLLGDKTIMEQNRDAFVATGTVHIIALSGYNVSVVADFFTKLFSFLPIRLALGAGGLSIVLFVLMTGAQSSAVRAGLMAVLVLFARIKGRTPDVGRAILFACTLMTIWNPWLLLYDVSFQLSFIATIGIVYVVPRIEKYFLWVRESVFKIPLRSIVSTTLGVQLFVLPFLLYATGNLSFIGPIANILIVPLVPILMLFGSTVALVGSITPIFALPFSFLTKLTAGIILWIISFLGSISFSATTITIPVVVMLGMYVLIIFWLDPFGWEKKKVMTTL